MTSNYKGDRTAPFNIYSSSVDTGYAAELSQSFMPGVDITDLHHDVYGNDNSSGMQGPFANAHVGGLQRRHVDLNSGTLDTESTRPEAFRIITNTGSLVVRGSEYNSQNVIDTALPRAKYYRDEYAKRPLNVRNIKSTTASQKLGNHYNDYEVIQTSGRYINNKKFVDLEGFSLTASRSPYLTSSFASAKVSRGRSGYIFVERFSAPGSLETMGDSDGNLWLDPHAAEYSPYNALPWRNLHVRVPINYRLFASEILSNQIHTHSNAVSDPNGNESIAISFGTDGWEFTGSGAGVGTYSTDSSVGTYAIDLSNTSASVGLEYSFPTVSGKLYRISLSAKVSGTVSNQGFFDWEGFSTPLSVEVSNTSYQTFSYDLIANASTAKIKVWAAGTSSLAGSGSSILFDNVSIQQVSTAPGGTRNNIVRVQQPLRTLLTQHADRHGLSGSAVAADYSGVANYHKVNRNSLTRPTDVVGVSKQVNDNWFVQHSIPRNDTQYAWINASYDAAPAGHATGSSEITFISESDIVAII